MTLNGQDPALEQSLEMNVACFSPPESSNGGSESMMPTSEEADAEEEKKIN